MAQFQVNMAFSADTGKAKAQIAELQSLLSKIAYTGSTTNVADALQKDLQEASTAAKELQFHLNNAFNVSTGKFDLSMLDKSLKTSGSNITDLSTKLLGAGATGQQAFATLAQSISLADQPMLRVSKRMQDFAVTMKNTVKWQLSSSMLHGFMGAIQSAYGYAQDLNKSLTDIRIVTGYSADQMAVFAEQANKAAKSLSTTTTDYTNASLIYFQQGLSDAEVAARTDITVKMANAAGQSAEIVSEQLTAVWNNFADGSKSLEYYADVMTALGAATASSSDEISEGLSKFAAVAESVGLSYEYATAALTTITSNTRESADVVGNALKTLFARIQGLKLGETLEDGVDLNKYSEALDKVGISVFEQNGELKAMDSILNEMAATWGTLSNAQQVALAQTVAGVRQYTQLIALMENWDSGDSDSFMANLDTIENAEGALQKQADIYADSWEAASKRVQASAEGIYQSLIDDDFFIAINNGFANLLNGLDAFIDGAGGIKTVLTGITSVIITSFANKIPEALDNFKYNLEIVTKGSQVAYQRIQNQMQEATKQAFDKFNDTMGDSGIQQDSALGYAIEQANELTAARNKLVLVSDKMSNAEKQSAEIQLNLIQAQQKEVVAIKEKNEELQESIRLQQQSIRQAQVSDNTRAKTLKSSEDMSNMYLSYNDTLVELEEQRDRIIQTINERSARGQNVQRQEDNLTRINAEIEQYEALSYAALGFADNYKATMQVLNNTNNAIGRELFDIFSQDNFDTALQHPIRFAEEFNIAFEQIEETLTDTNLDFDDKLNLKTVKDQIRALQSTIPEVIQSATGLDTAFNRVFTAMDEDQLQQAFLGLRLSINNCTLEGEDFQRVLEGLYGKSITQIANDMQRLADGTAQAEQKASALKTLLDEFNPSHTVRISEAMGSLAGLMGDVVTIGNTLASTFQALGNPDLNGWEKFSAVLTGLSVLIPTVLSSLQAAATINTFLQQSYGKSAVAVGIDTVAKTINTKITTALGIANTGLVASMGPLLVIIGAVAAAILIAVGAFKLLKWVFDLIQASSPEGKLETAKEATEGMASAAEDATTAYQELLNTISGYDSAISSLENLEVGTEEFTNALITANEAAWDLINTYGLIKGTDWDYGENGEIIITQEAKNSITDQVREQKENIDVGLSATKIAEAQAAYNVATSKGGQVGFDLATGAIEGGALFKALGLETGEFEGLKQMMANSDGAIPKEFADRVAQALSGVNFDELTSDKQQYIFEHIFNQLDSMEQMYNAYANLQKVQGNEIERSISTSLSDEEAYQQSAWKDVILDQLNSQYESEKQKADSRWDNEGEDAKTEAEIAQAFADYLGDQNYIQGEDGKVYKKNADGSQGEEVTELSNLTTEAQRNILATADAINILEASGVSMAEGFNQVASTMTEEETAMADALINGNLGALTEEQIEKLKAVGDIKPEDLFDPETLAAIRNNPILNEALEGWLTNLEKSVAEWQPPEFNLETWKADYAAKMDIINDLETGDTISAEDYAILGEEYSQYFQVQADGTAILIAKAEELRAAAQGIEIGELEEDIRTKQDTISAMDEANIITESGRELDFNAAHNAATKGTLHETWDEAYINAVNEALGTTYETSQQAAEGYNNYVQSLNDSQSTLASTAESVDELYQMYMDGLIDLEELDSNLEGTIMEEAIAEDLDPDTIMDMADAYENLINANEDWTGSQKDAEKASKKLAVANARTQKGIDDLAEGWEDWSEALKDGNKLSEKYQKAISGIEGAMEDMLGIDIGLLSEGFAESAVEAGIFERLVKGDLTALDDLRQMAATDIVQHMNLDTTNFEGAQQYLLDAIAAFEAEDVEIGTSLETTGFYEALNSLINQTDITATQIASILDAIGFEPEVTTMKIPVEQFHASSDGTQFTAQYLDSEGNTQTKVITSEQYNNAANVGYVEVPVINAKTTVYSGGGGGGGYTPPKNTGGGGGGGGSTPKHAEKKNDSDKERYHTLNNQLEDLQSQYDQIAEAKDRAFGKDKLKAIDDEIAKTQELIEKNEEYIAEAEKNVGIDKAVMEEYYNRSIGGPAIQYDENGNISNYDEIQDAMYAKYNQMADTYDEESDEWIQFEKDYEQFEKWLENYESSTDILRDKQAERQELINQQMDLELEKIQYQIELKMNVAEDSLALLEFQMEQLEDKAFNAAESISLFTDKANLLYEQMITDREGLDKILGQQLSDAEIKMFYEGDMSVLEGKTFTEDQMQAIKDYRDNLLELNSELMEVQKQVEEQVMEAFEEYHDELDRGMEKFDHYNNMLESYQNIVDIVGKDVLGLDNEALAAITDAQVENSINQLKASKDAYDSLQKQADDALQKQQEAEMKAALARAKGDEETAKSYEEDAEFWKETYTEMNEAAVEAQEEMMDNWGNTLEAIATQFELAVERAVEAFNDAIYEFGGLEGMSDDFSRQKEIDDMYLEDYQKIYELSKLTRDINNTIDDTENIAGKQKLKKLLEEINQLQEDGVEMSEYDLEYLQAEYNLRLAELELEEAQKAKDTVRLSRDNEGNWSYVYTQNTDAVDAAQQKYEDALYAMQDLSSNYIDEMSEQLIATSQEMQEALANVRVEDFASQEEYYAELARIEAQYQEQMAAQEAELNKAVANNKELYDTDWKNYSQATGYKISAAEDFATKFSDTLLGSMIGSEEATSNFTAIVGEATDSLVQGLANAAATYYTNLNTAMEAAGTSTSEFADLLAEDVEAIKEDSKEAADAVAAMAEKMDEEMTKITERVQKFQEDYGKEIDKIIAKNLEMVETFNDMLEHLSIDPDQINVTYDISRSQDGEGGDTVEVPEGTASGYTGMYTGDWGSDEGRVAVLHEKELLLNQDDTVNMLEALKVSKYMLEILNANTQMLSQGMGAMLPASIDNSISEVLEQQVSIVAEFPNAVNHSEIEEAFDTLINRAAQYANRK